MIYLIKESEHYTGKIGELVAMLYYFRDVLRKEISSLTRKELDYIAYKGANPIGALILPIALIEYVHQIILFEERDLVSDELCQWEFVLFLGEKARNQINSQSLK
ncbi:hypothetical protein Q73_08815 [Bacillus coahuilensis m2-6]|uniref:Uncharacterized protein n=1 Tax=Bacillus coahuilensis p1.1.43 TaxID=1150625 RepID=A0A147K7P4_9BACI|nr:hypothetical protein [Bacillus coahuilensis]KUP06130.1 hypothetical protein Q75_09310 [Bacillus coahuilensis p1.1.43]KUP07473.1 hypothetical protein Q73_08815 [Bacillus coahuilensis m2-6]